MLGSGSDDEVASRRAAAARKLLARADALYDEMARFDEEEEQRSIARQKDEELQTQSMGLIEDGLQSPASLAKTPKDDDVFGHKIRCQRNMDRKLLMEQNESIRQRVASLQKLKQRVRQSLKDSTSSQRQLHKKHLKPQSTKSAASVHSAATHEKESLHEPSAKEGTRSNDAETAEVRAEIERLRLEMRSAEVDLLRLRERDSALREMLGSILPPTKGRSYAASGTSVRR